MCEYRPNKMVIYAQPTHLFIVHNWKVLKRIEDDDSKNIAKFFISPIPNFDETTFPFIVMSGESSFNILNVQDGHIEPLIQAASSVKDAQTAFFFEVEESSAGNTSVAMHFPTKRLDDEKMRQNWHKMCFHEDVLHIMKQHGCLPVSTPAKALKLHDELKQLRQPEESKLLEENKKLKARIQELER